ncbi:MAG: phage head-tail connector protein [Candidatus Izemoplasmatales bacterium]
MKSYVDLDEFKNFIKHNSDNDDELLENLLEEVSSIIDSYCGRSFHQDKHRQVFYGDEVDFTYPIYLNQTPVASIDMVLKDGVDITSSLDIKLNKKTGRVKFSSLNNLELADEIIIEYTGGYSNIPNDIKLAVKLQTAFFFQRKDTVGAKSFSSQDGSLNIVEDFELLKVVKQILDVYKIRRV